MKSITRHSKQREAILSLVCSTKTHPTAEWLYSNLKEVFPGIGLATVYRNLKFFEEQGLVQRIDVGDSYEHYDADISLHYHFFCRKCRSVIDLDMPQMVFEPVLPGGLVAERHQLVFFGVCHNCQQEQCS